MSEPPGHNPSPGSPKPNPAMEGLTAPVVPVGGPDHLGVLIRELDRRLAQQDSLRSWAATRDALGFLTRYFSGLLPAAWRSLAAPPPEVLVLWREGRSTAERVQLIGASLTALRNLVADSLARLLVEAFYDSSGRPRMHTCLLGLGIPPEGMQALPEWFASTQEPPPREVCEQQLRRYLPALQEWLQAAGRYFQDCDHRFETGSKFGQMELVVRFREKTLKTGFTLRLREGRKSGVIQAPFSPGARPQPQPQPPAQDTEELTQLIVSMLHREHTEAPRKKEQEEPAQEPVPEVAGPPRLYHQVSYLGSERSQAGSYCYRGRIEISMPDDKPVAAQVRASHSKVTVKPTSFNASYARIDYWIVPAAVSDGQSEYVIIQTPNEVRKLPLTSLLPSTKLLNLSPARAAAMLLAPGVIGTSYILFRFYYALHQITRYLMSYTSSTFQQVYLGRQPVPLGGSGISAIEVDVMPLAESTALFYFLLAVVGPLITTKLFQRLPNRQQSEMGLVYLLAMVLPLVVMAVLLTGTALSSPYFIHPELKVMSFGLQFPWFAGFNLAASTYLFLSVTNLLDDWVRNQLLRTLLPLVLFGAFVATSIYLVYGG